MGRGNWGGEHSAPFSFHKTSPTAPTSSLLCLCRRCLKFSDDTVRRHAAACLRELVRHGDALAQAVAAAPGDALHQLAAYAASTSSAQALPALTALGFAAEHSPELAAKVAAAPGTLAALNTALQCGDENCQAAAAWALGRVGGQAPALAAAIASSLPRLCALVGAAPADSTVHAKCLKAAGSIIGQHADVAQLAALVMQPGLVPDLLERLLARCAVVMAKQPATRAAFASSGALAHLEAWQAELPGDSAVGQHAAACLRLFPEVRRVQGRRVACLDGGETMAGSCTSPPSPPPPPYQPAALRCFIPAGAPAPLQPCLPVQAAVCPEHRASACRRHRRCLPCGRGHPGDS